jgi:hypothetical protein
VLGLDAEIGFTFNLVVNLVVRGVGGLVFPARAATKGFRFGGYVVGRGVELVRLGT